MTGPPGPVIPCQRRKGRRGVPRLRNAGRYAARAKRSTGTVESCLPPIYRAKLARRIYDVSHLVGSFTLRSGVVSDQYFDKYRFEADPALLAEIGGAVAALVPAESDGLAGLELGGVPIATVAAQVLGLPARFVRKAAKEYGTCELAEGGPVSGMRLCIIEDVVTSGGAVLDAAAALRERGASVGPVVCVIDRESGGRENLAAADLELHAVFTMSDLQGAR